MKTHESEHPLQIPIILPLLMRLDTRYLYRLFRYDEVVYWVLLLLRWEAEVELFDLELFGVVDLDG